MFPLRLNRAKPKQQQRRRVFSAPPSHQCSFCPCFPGLPVLVVGVTLAVSGDKYKADDRCWLSVETNTIWAFVGPAVFVLAVRARVSSSVLVSTCARLVPQRCSNWKQRLINLGTKQRTPRKLFFTD